MTGEKQSRATDWYVRRKDGGEESLSPAEMRQRAADGRLGPEDNVRRGADGPWLTAKEVRGLFPVVATSAYDVFVSHSSTDKAEVDGIIHTLESQGIRCWVAPRDLLPGFKWGEAIILGMESCRVLLLVLTRDSNASPQIAHEVERAVAKGLIVVPFRLEDVHVSKQLEYFVSSVHWLDAFTEPLEKHSLELARILQRVLSATPAPPPRAVGAARATPRRARRPVGRGRIAAIGLVLALVAAAGLWQLVPRSRLEAEDAVHSPAAEVSPMAGELGAPAPDPLDVLGDERVDAVRKALAWMLAHQSDNGAWDCDGFTARCGKLGDDVCGGPGMSTHDVGITGLALLALLRSIPAAGPYDDSVARAADWLSGQQDPDSGLLGERRSHDFIYDHAIATGALCEAYARSKSPQIKATAIKAINFILKARNPYGAWRYDVPPAGDNDTSVTGWMVFALASAKDAGLEGDLKGAFDGALSFIDEVTDPASGRVGYSAFGELSSRTPANEHFPREKGEAMTAVGLLCRLQLGQTADDFPILLRHADLIRRKLPSEDHLDLYYWYYATAALWRLRTVSPAFWKTWDRRLGETLLDTQVEGGDEEGSWSPSDDVWGWSGGRIGSTAFAVLALVTPLGSAESGH